MGDCRLTNKVKELLDQGGEIHSEIAIRIDNDVFKVQRDGSTVLLYQVSDLNDDEKLHINFTQSELVGPFG